ncbi:MAG: hypothetical protein PHG67_08565 [Bacteroidales bacterium]|nr:hypothetical protein [Bacteroidales bacterium]
METAMYVQVQQVLFTQLKVVNHSIPGQYQQVEQFPLEELQIAILLPLPGILQVLSRYLLIIPTQMVVMQKVHSFCL